MTNTKTIVIFDGSLSTTSFINSLAKGLTQSNRVIIIGFDSAISNPISGVTYVSLGSAMNSFDLLKKTLLITSRSFLRNFSFKGVKTLFRFMLSWNKRELQQYNFDSTLELLKPDILHIQWPSLLPWCETVLNKKEIKTVLSQRGYQTNVRPFVDPENFDYLSNIYPKIGGFHSVSKAISNKGDLIWDASNKIDEVVYTGIAPETLTFKETYQKNDTLKVISIGRPHWKKDYTTAIRAFHILKNKGYNFHYTIIGATGNEELLYLVNQLNLKDYISITGKISQDEVYQKVQASSLFLLPSLEEGIANVAVEAMALGTPIITSDCGGMTELVSHGVEGWIFSVLAPKELSECIEQFLQLDMGKINEIRNAARLKIESQHSLESMIRGMENLYDKLFI